MGESKKEEDYTSRLREFQKITGVFFRFLLLVWSGYLPGVAGWKKIIVLRRRDREAIKRSKIDFLLYCVFAQALQQKQHSSSCNRPFEVVSARSSCVSEKGRAGSRADLLPGKECHRGHKKCCAESLANKTTSSVVCVFDCVCVSAVLRIVRSVVVPNTANAKSKINNINLAAVSWFYVSQPEEETQEEKIRIGHRTRRQSDRLTRSVE